MNRVELSMTPVLPILLALALLTFASSAASFDSDDFNRANLDPDRWELVNPLGDGSVRMTGTGTQDAHLELAVPEGPTHDPWHTNRSVRAMQTTSDQDFEIEARFTSEPAVRYQLQGLVVEQDDANWIRFDTFHDGSALRIFAATTTAGSSTGKINVIVAPGDVEYLRVRRETNQWTFSHSSDGSSWTTAGTFSHTLVVTAVGPFGANHTSSGTAPAFTASVDYCFDVSAPIIPEDGTVSPDTVAPLIHGIDVAMQPGAALLSWFTDEPALGWAEYGTSPAYEFGSVSDSGGTFDHAVSLPGLVPGNTYHYRVHSEDDSAQASATADLQFTFDPGGPTIDVWYGLEQSFGQLGHPQPWVNILGHVSDPDGVSSITYSLNGGAAVNLTIGPDGRRLVSSGDWNADLIGTDLLPGANTLLLTATDQASNVTTETVLVNWQGGTVWPLPYSVDWGGLFSDADIQNVAQVVDGKWTLEGDVVRTVEPGYDRLVAIGDTTWTDYEVTVPITLNTAPGGAGVGILFRWLGHTDDPVFCVQPHCGWLPLGAILWYRPGRLEVYGNGGTTLDSKSMTLAIGTTYWFRGRVETTPIGALYRLRVWEDGTPEPSGWDITGQADLTDPSHGSSLLITHQADVSFGEVSITEIGPPVNLPPVANDDLSYVTPGDSVLINVLANDFDVDGSLDSTSVTIGTGPLHGLAAVDPVTGVITYTHDASPTTADSLTYTVRDDDGDLSNEAAVRIAITDDPAPQITSDDFNRCVLDPGLWTFENPMGDGSHVMVGAGTGDAWLELSLPAGSAHDAWGAGGQNEAVRVMQNVSDADLLIEAHWKAEPTAGYNDQGILVEQDDDNWLRFDVYHSNASLKAFLGKTIGGSNSTLLNSNIATGSALYMRVRRTGDLWTMELSSDGATYTQAGQFTQALNVTQVGVYAANPVDALQWTSQADWLFDVADPIVPEDGGVLGVTVGTEGDGAVTVSDSPPYDCDDIITLAAAPAPGWVFDRWEGDLTGSDNPAPLTIVGPMEVTAVFTLEPTTVTQTGVVPGVLAFRGARPNPFRSSAELVFDLPSDATVDMTVYSVSGRLVRRLVRGQRLSAGRHSTTWDGRLQDGTLTGPGVYFVRVTTERGSATGRLLRTR